ncbi:uncharacterized protein [Bemisia tabaci]|uniref:uncharacterized protein n=1 Tax=Bemisia tabaci TaxID=7038 RepID=UPI003B27ED55
MIAKRATGLGRSKSSPIKGTPRSRSRSTIPRKERLWVGEDPPSSESLGAPVNPYAPSSSRPLATRWIGKDPEGDSQSDWRDPADTYPEVQNQVWYGRMCGSCWAFAVNSAIEILWALDQKEVTILSAQDLIDCVKECNGCKGGSLKPTLEHIRREGVAKAKDYPYWAESGTCFKHIPRYLRINHFEQVKTQGEMEAALSRSPLPTGIHQPDELQHYASGIYNSNECKSDEKSLNHAATIVGHYEDAWIVRNTLGTAFGLAGHLLVEKGRCGIGHETFAVYGPELMPQPQG